MQTSLEKTIESVRLVICGGGDGLTAVETTTMTIATRGDFFADKIEVKVNQTEIAVKRRGGKEMAAVKKIFAL